MFKISYSKTEEKLQEWRVCFGGSYTSRVKIKFKFARPWFTIWWRNLLSNLVFFSFLVNWFYWQMLKHCNSNLHFFLPSYMILKKSKLVKFTFRVTVKNFCVFLKQTVSTHSSYDWLRNSNLIHSTLNIRMYIIYLNRSIVDFQICAKGYSRKFWFLMCVFYPINVRILFSYSKL